MQPGSSWPQSTRVMGCILNRARNATKLHLDPTLLLRRLFRPVALAKDQSRSLEPTGVGSLLSTPDVPDSLFGESSAATTCLCVRHQHSSRSALAQNQRILLDGSWPTHSVTTPKNHRSPLHYSTATMTRNAGSILLLCVSCEPCIAQPCRLPRPIPLVLDMIFVVWQASRSP